MSRDLSRRLLLVGLAGVVMTMHGPAWAHKVGPWGPIAKLRDDTNQFPQEKPAGGWYVAPIHATLRASDGKVLISGFGPGESNCTSGQGGTAREHGESFISIRLISMRSTTPLYRCNRSTSRPRIRCTRSFIAPVKPYWPTGESSTWEEPNTRASFQRRFPGVWPQIRSNFRSQDQRLHADHDTDARRPSRDAGNEVVPTNVRMPDGRVLTVGSFTGRREDLARGRNRSLEIFDPKIWDADHAANPFTVLTQHSDVPTDYHSGGRGYVNLFRRLPKPVPAAQGGGFARSVAFAGNQAQMRLFSAEAGPTGGQRLFTPKNASSPNPSSFEKGEGSSGVMLPDLGKLMFVDGGHDGMGAQRAYFYDPYADSWTTLDTGISRIYPTAIWLPNGTVLVVNGYTSEPSSTNDVSNPLGGADGVRKPQIHRSLRPNGDDRGRVARANWTRVPQFCLGAQRRSSPDWRR